MRTDCFAHSCAQTSVRMRTDCAQTAHRCAQQLCASSPTSVRIFTALMCNFVLIIPHRCSPTSVRMRTDCAQTAHRLRTDAHRRRCASSPLDIQFLTDDLLRPPLLQPRPIFTVFYGNKAQKPVKRSILITNIKYPTRYETSQYLTI